MHNGNLLSAAMRFLELDAETLADFSLVISHEDIALYGALCALATLGAADLRSGLREASKFRRFLEAAPSVRSLVNSFLDGRFFESIQWLESNRPLMLLDIHLSSCVDVVIGAIRDQIFVRYTTPYRTVCLSRMVRVTASESQLVFIAADTQIVGCGARNGSSWSRDHCCQLNS